MTSVSAFSLLCVRKVCLSLICDDVHFSPLFFSAVQQWLGALQRQHNFGVSHYSLSSGWWKRSLNKLWKSLKSSAFTTAMLFINMLVSINRCLQKRPKAAKIKAAFSKRKQWYRNTRFERRAPFCFMSLSKQRYKSSLLNQKDTLCACQPLCLPIRFLECCVFSYKAKMSYGGLRKAEKRRKNNFELIKI